MIDITLFGGEKNIDILKSKMWLDLEYIQKKILKDTPLDKDRFTELFNFMVKNVEVFETTDKDDFSSIRDRIASKFSVINNDILYEMLDPFRKWYGDFCYGGIIQAYRGIDAEFWYPKIIFKERIESDISELPEEIILYRGTSIDEYDSKSYGQSWSLSKEVAEEFAYKYYIHELNRTNVNSDRVILEIKVNRNDILFYEKEPIVDEKEVIIDSNLYKNRARIIDKKTLDEIENT